MKNKVLEKYLMPHYIAATVFVVLSLFPIAMIPKNSKLTKLVFQDELRGRSDTKNFALVLMAAVCLGLASLEGIVTPKRANKKTNALTVEYLQHIFTQYPELQRYESILKDQTKLQEIATVICNGLSASEQEEISRIVKRTFNKSSDAMKSYAEEKAEIDKAEHDILQIINKHAANHPEHMQNILSLIDRDTYIMDINGKKSILFVKDKSR